MTSFEFIFALEMHNPIFSLILKTSLYLQPPDINFITTIHQEIIIDVMSIFIMILPHCVMNDDNKTEISVTRQRKMSYKIDSLSHTQHFFNTKKN